MGTRTIKIGSAVTIKDNDRKAVVTGMQGGYYLLDDEPVVYWPFQIIAEKTKPAAKKRTQVNQVSAQQAKLNAIYSILSKEYKQHNKTCIARFPGCTIKATEIHHRFKRSGFWLIMTNFFLPICKKCHRYATPNSKEAIKKGVSISRLSNPPYSFTAREHELMKQFGVNPP